MFRSANQLKTVPAPRRGKHPEGLPFRDFYHILGLGVEVGADEARLLEPFRQKYASFLGPPLWQADCSLYLLGQRIAKPLIIADGKVTHISAIGQMAGYAQMLFVNSLVSKLKTHFLIHAGVVARDSQGIIIVGPSSLGKTTLALSLVKRGFLFLSDEFAPIHRQTRLIDPFPRAIGLRIGAARLFCDINLQQLDSFKNLGGYRKWLYDVSRLNNERPKPCNSKILIVLNHHPKLEQKEKHIVDVALYQPQGQVISVLANTCSINLLSVNWEAEYPVYRFSLEKKKTVIERFTRICQEYQSEVIYHERVYDYIPQFEAAPTLKPLAKSQAIMEILKNLMNFTQGSLLHEEFSGRLPAIIVELGRMIQDTNCYALSVGRLGRMVELVEGVMSYNERH